MKRGLTLLTALLLAPLAALHAEPFVVALDRFHAGQPTAEGGGCSTTNSAAPMAMPTALLSHYHRACVSMPSWIVSNYSQEFELQSVAIALMIA